MTEATFGDVPHGSTFHSWRRCGCVFFKTSDTNHHGTMVDIVALCRNCKRDAALSRNPITLERGGWTERWHPHFKVRIDPLAVALQSKFLAT